MISHLRAHMPRPIMHTIGGSHNCGQVKDCLMDASDAKSQPAQVEPEDCLRTCVAPAPRAEWRFSGFVCSPNWISSELRGSIRTRREEPVPQRTVQPLQSARPSTISVVGASGKATGTLSCANHLRTSTPSKRPRPWLQHHLACVAVRENRHLV